MTSKSTPTKNSNATQLIELVSLSEACEDDGSPIFRAKLQEAEENVEHLYDALKKMLKSARSTISAGNAYSQSVSQFIADYSEVAELGRKIEPTEVGSTFANDISFLVSQIQELEKHRDTLLQQLNSAICTPIENFCTNDIKQVKDQAKKFAKSYSTFDSMASRASKPHKTGSKPQAPQVDLANARQVYKKATVEYTSQLNKFNARRRIELLERTMELLQLHMDFFRAGYQQLLELEPRLQKMKQQVQAEKRALAELEKKAEEVIDDLEKEGGSSTTGTSGSTAATQPSSQQMVMKGYLYKKNRNISLQEWKRAYFQVKDGCFTYVKHSKNGRSSEEPIDLLLCTVKPCPDAGRDHCFEIVSPYKNMILNAESAEVMNQWMTVLQNNIAQQLNKQKLENNKSVLSAQKQTKLRSNTVAHGSAQKDANAEEQERKKVLAELYTAEPMNEICADCDAQKPTWASIRLGVLICIECSGIHRSLGTHVSKVRSMMLDKLDPETILFLSHLGNKRVNSVFEGNMPINAKKPTARSPRSERERWIRGKYVDKNYVPKYTGLSIDKDMVKAVRQKDFMQAYKLLVQGANPNYVDVTDGNKSLLHISTALNDISMMELLLQFGADPNPVAADKNWTPLHFCAANDWTTHAVLLIKRGANIEAKDKDGKTPVDVAVEAQHAHSVTLLRLAQQAHEERKTRKMDDQSFGEAFSQFAVDLTFRQSENKPQ